MNLSRSMLAVMVAGVALVCGGVAQAEPPAEAPKSPAETKPAAEPAEKPATPAETPAPATSEEKLVYVKLNTTKGDIFIELNNEKAPITVKNFLSYVEKKHYDGTIFHRVMDGFMIQGGGHTEDLAEKPTGPSIKNEAGNGLKNERGTIAMARKPDLNSATAQFFINVVDNPFLDNPSSPYAVFGKVVGGMDVVDKIKSVKTGNKSTPNGMPMQNVPVETVKINSVTKVAKEEAVKK